MPEFEDLGFMDLKSYSDNMQLPDPYLAKFWRMSKERIFCMNDEINENVWDLQQEILYINKQDFGVPVEQRIPIKIFIDSPGGYLTEAMSLCQFIQMSKTPVYTINMGDCFSGASLLLMAGHKRYSIPGGTVLIHAGDGTVSGTHEQVMAQSADYKRQVDKMAAFIMSHSSIDEKTFKKYKNKEWYLSTDEALKYGIIDAVITDFDIILGENS